MVSPLERLREIRDQQLAAKALTRERDLLIRRALRNNSERAVAAATGLSHQRVHEIAEVAGR